MEESYVANIVEFTGGINVQVTEDGIKPEKKTRKSIKKFGYILGTTIATGSYSKVKLCYSKKLNGNVAVKIIPKKRLPEEYINKFVPREIALLQKLEHPGLIKLLEVFETENSLYLVMDYMSGGDVLDYVNSVGSLHEADARRLFKQLLDVVSYLHNNSVYHRDIKLDNILIDSQYNIRLTDLGFARFNPRQEQLQTFCGSYTYAPPEVLDGDNYIGAKADIWSMGVCLFGMLNGKLPFRDTDHDVLRESMKERIKFYKHVSRDGRDLVRAILEPDPRKRYTLRDIIHSNWMCRPIKTGGTMSMSSLAVVAVTDDTGKASMDTVNEHGFSCSQNSTEPYSNKVTGVLRSVAVNHSTGKSSINLNTVKSPIKKASSIAMTTGITGPAGRRISVQLGISPDVEPEMIKANPLLSTVTEKPATGLAKLGAALGNKEGGAGKASFKKAVKALNKFKCAVRVVTATKRFKRGPLTTILKIPQEKAMEKMIERRGSDQVHEIHHLAYTDGAKVANMLLKDVQKSQELKRQSSQHLEAERCKIEDIQSIENTLNFIIP